MPPAMAGYGPRRTYEERIQDLEARIAVLRAGIRAREERRRAAAARGPREGPRFSPGWVAAHRARLGLSAADYGRLVGVTGLTIYNWEKGRGRPRAKQLTALAEVRGMGVREARQRLGLGGATRARRRRAKKA
jgi:DNA-binding transcriptional regulator YiaG